MAWPKGVSRKDFFANKAKFEAENEKPVTKELSVVRDIYPKQIPTKSTTIPPGVYFGVQQIGNLWRLVRVRIDDDGSSHVLASEPTTRVDALQAYHRYSYDQFWEEREVKEFHV